MIQAIKNQNPLIHHITNFVSANLCANITLALGASPLMADEEDEMSEIAELSSALLVNLGTLNYRTLDSAIEAMDFYTKLNKPIIIDPVGVGASAFRTAGLNELLRGGKAWIIKANAGEIASIIGLTSSSKGADGCQEISKDFLAAAKDFATENDLVLAISGEQDYVVSKSLTVRILGGSPMCKQITGIGCALGSAISAAACVLPPMQASINALVAFNLASSRAQMSCKGLAAFEAAFRDELFFLNEADLEKAILSDAKQIS